jgi:hypothetical protein
MKVNWKEGDTVVEKIERIIVIGENQSKIYF